MFWFGLISILIAFLLLLQHRKPKFYPPGPPFFPFIGNVLTISKHLKELKFHHLVWQYFTKYYGSIVGLKLVNTYLVVVSGKDLIRQLYNREELNGRPDGFFFRIRSFGKRLGIVFTDGCFWEQQRRFSVRTLRCLGLGKISMIEHVEREALELLKHLDKKSKNSKDIFVQKDNSNIFDLSVMNVTWTILRGSRFELEDQQLIMLMEMIHKSFQIIDMSGGILSQLPWLRFIAPEKTGYSQLIKTLEPLWDFLNRNIEEVLESYDKKCEPKNFIEFYCREISNRASADSVFTQEQLLALCIDFFQAGSETTSNTLAFAILYMLHYPHVMEKVQHELDNVIGNRMPKMADRPNLKYTEATINEVQRMSNVAPLGIAHRAKTSIKVGDYVIPKDACVLFNIYNMHMDESYWKDANKFEPNRFLNAGELINHDNFIPFGLGKRRCIGENLAKTSLFLFFTSFLHFFNIESVHDLPDLMGKDGITLSPNSFRVKLIRRNNSITL